MITIDSKYPVLVDDFVLDLNEVMYYLYLPVSMDGGRDIRLPPNVECLRDMIETAADYSKKSYKYVYLSARKGWASPDNPLNRPGWHADGFGTDDINFVWWRGRGTRFAVQKFEVSEDHVDSLDQFTDQIDYDSVITPSNYGLYMIDSSNVHATPIIEAPGAMRQYVKISLSNQEYNLENNSHNYLFDYKWDMHPRHIVRNDTQAAQIDYYASAP